jgi:probable phosphoglycerate mutase
VEAALREVDFGGWEGRTGPEVERDWATELAAWRAGAPVRPPGGETVAEVAARVAAARDGVARRYPGGTVLLVSHLYPIRTSVADALGVPAATIHRMALGPASLSEIRGTGVLVRYNDESHLD